MHAIPLAIFKGQEQAEAARKKLNRAGYHSKVRRSHLYPPIGNVLLEVKKDEFSSATKTLQNWRAAGEPLKGVICCPQCKSPRVEYSQLTRKFLLPNIAAALCLLFFRRKMYCQDCHYTWREPISWGRKAQPYSEIAADL
jgi:hypothetical protein